MTGVLEGLGVAVPPRVVTNEDLAARLDTSDEWIRTRTGISRRHHVDPGVATVDLAAEAGKRALKSAGGGHADAVLVATTTPDRLCPSVAPEVATRLELEHVAALDLNAVCTGFVYGLAAASGLLAAGIAERVVLIGAEVISRHLDPEDRSTAVIFGDGAGAAVLRAGSAEEPGAIGPFDLGSDGAGADLIQAAAGGTRQPLDADVLARGDQYLRMEGREVYRHAVPRMVTSSERVLAAAGWTIDDVDRLVAHQANARILEAVASRLGIDQSRCELTVDQYGNTSSASIPLTLAAAALTPGEQVLLTAFGGGLTWGSAVLTWPDVRPG